MCTLVQKDCKQLIGHFSLAEVPIQLALSWLRIIQPVSESKVSQLPSVE